MKKLLSCATGREENEAYCAATTSATTPQSDPRLYHARVAPVSRTMPRTTAQQRNVSLSEPPARLQETELTILLIGRTGNGKSFTGNSILGREVFVESTGILSATEHTQLGETRHLLGSKERKVQVVDLPDVLSDMDDQTAAREVQDAITLMFPGPSAICVVVRADIRFTPEEYATYRQMMEMVKSHVPEAGERLVVVFTMADKLPPNLRDSFPDQLRKANTELKTVVQDAKGHYVLLGKQQAAQTDTGLGNGERRRSSCTKSTEYQRELSKLLQHVFQLHVDASATQISVMLFGAPGSGKSATGNTLCHPHHLFSVHTGMASVGKADQQEEVNVRGYKLHVLDTTDDPRQTDQDDQWRARFRTGQHVLLLVLPANQRFQPHHMTHLTALKGLLGSDVTKHVIVVLTAGDTLTNADRCVEDEIIQAPTGLRSLLEEVGGRYVVLDNTSTCPTQRLLFRNRLLKAVAQLHSHNKSRVLRLRRKSTSATATASSSWPSLNKCTIS